MVFVLDRRQRPLMPCNEKRARLLLARGRAVVHRRYPFTIRLRDRLLRDSALQPVVMKLDPGSQVTGVAIVREEQAGDSPMHHALHLAEIVHRGDQVRRRMQQRAAYRRRRRSANLRHRAPRFANRWRPKGWLAPSLRSRVDNICSLARRYRQLAPITRVDVELVKFDTQRVVTPEITGAEYQHGTLWGYEVREYLLEKWGRRCAYCKRDGMPLQVDHIMPKSRSGSGRISNLTLSCRRCNEAKGNRTAAEFGHPELGVHAQVPLRDAAAMNATRWAIYREVRALGVDARPWTGGRTKWNRTRFGLAKTHAIDALCVGAVSAVCRAATPVLVVTAVGRGRRSRTNTNACGFPRGYFIPRKCVHGFATGDLVRADVPCGKYSGIHVGRVAIRASGSFRVGRIDGISWRHCRILQRADGYTYQQSGQNGGAAPSSPGLRAGASGVAASR